MTGFTQFPRRTRSAAPMALSAALLLSAAVTARSAQQLPAPTAKAPAARRHAGPLPGQQTFASAQKAVQALVEAVQADNAQALRAILGPDAEQIVSSGDAAKDRQDRQQFLDKYRQMHRLLTEQDGLTTLYVGAENWPLPIPLAQAVNAWYFDAVAAKSEILYRRIGRNELTVIQICGELAAAEKEYDAAPHDGAKDKEYAQKLMSSPGKHDGLYWPAAQGAPQSPLGPFLAAAEKRGGSAGSSLQAMPFYGYYFRILTAQGVHAPGGAESYLASGKMTRGFAFLAYPAAYRSSGVMTFLVGPDGVVYQKDLGPKTEAVAQAMQLYDPDPTWQEAN